MIVQSPGFLLLNAIISIVVSLVTNGAIYLAKGRDDKKRDAREAFTGLRKNIGMFHALAVDVHFKWYESQPGEMDISGKRYPSEKLNEMYADLTSISVALDADALLLRFIFGRKSQALCSVIDEIKELVPRGQHPFDHFALIPALNELTERATAEMEQLWKSLDAPPFGD
jgi:hypothetical protein